MPFLCTGSELHCFLSCLWTIRRALVPTREEMPRNSKKIQNSKKKIPKTLHKDTRDTKKNTKKNEKLVPINSK